MAGIRYLSRVLALRLHVRRGGAIPRRYPASRAEFPAMEAKMGPKAEACSMSRGCNGSKTADCLMPTCVVMSGRSAHDSTRGGCMSRAHTMWIPGRIVLRRGVVRRGLVASTTACLLIPGRRGRNTPCRCPVPRPLRRQAPPRVPRWRRKTSRLPLLAPVPRPQRRQRRQAPPLTPQRPHRHRQRRRPVRMFRIVGRVSTEGSEAPPSRCRLPLWWRSAVAALPGRTRVVAQ